MGTKDNGFAISNPELSNFYSSEVGDGRIVGSMAHYKDNKVWLTNEKGLWLYDAVDKTHQGPFTSSGAQVSDDKANDKLTSLVYDKRLKRYGYQHVADSLNLTVKPINWTLSLCRANLATVLISMLTEISGTVGIVTVFSFTVRQKGE